MLYSGQMPQDDSLFPSSQCSITRPPGRGRLLVVLIPNPMLQRLCALLQLIVPERQKALSSTYPLHLGGSFISGGMGQECFLSTPPSINYSPSPLPQCSPREGVPWWERQVKNTMGFHFPAVLTTVALVSLWEKWFPSLLPVQCPKGWQIIRTRTPHSASLPMGAMAWMFVSPPNSYAEILAPKCDVISSWELCVCVCGEAGGRGRCYLTHKGGALWNVISGSLQRSREISSPFHLVETQWESTGCELGRGSLPNHAGSQNQTSSLQNCEK